jgi:uncharacterized repeat protein (TIGR01451 family)
MTKTHRPGARRRRAAFAAAALAGPLIALSPQLSPFLPHSGPSPSASAARAAAAAKGPELRIGVSDGRQSARPGILLTYTVKIHNIGTVSVPRLHLEQSLPPGLTLISVTGHGTRGAGQVRWQLPLPPGHADVFRVVAKVGKTPGKLLRLATVACASANGNGKPIVCATDSDELPAGAAAAAAAVTHARQAGPGPGPGYLRPVSAILAFGIVAVAGGWWLAIRRRARHAL